MRREDRRRFEREFKKIRTSDNCTICNKPFPHNTRTFGGLTSNGTVVFAGECCARQVLSVMHSIYFVCDEKHRPFGRIRQTGPQEAQRWACERRPGSERHAVGFL